jgi:hypothetical protein
MKPNFGGLVVKKKRKQPETGAHYWKITSRLKFLV